MATLVELLASELRRFTIAKNAEQSSGREIGPRSNFASGKYDHARTPIFPPVAMPALIVGAVIVTVVP